MAAAATPDRREVTSEIAAAKLRARRCCCLLLVLATLVPVLGMADETPNEFPDELTKFEPYDKNPVFKGAGEGHWDVKIRERGWILREGDLWRMWYTGYDGTRPGKKMLGYATSNDGLVWERYAKNPIESEQWVEDVCVIPHDGMYYMFAEGEQDHAHLMTSRDGIAWDRVGQLDIRLVNGDPISDGPFGTPTAWFENGIWSLFYERRDLGIWLARSKDALHFTNVLDEPVIGLGPDAYDQDMIAMNQIVKYKGRYYAVLHGTKKSADPVQPNIWSTSLAMSTDLINWKKFPGNPIRPISENKSSGLLIEDGRQFRLYTMHNEVNVHFPATTPSNQGVVQSANAMTGSVPYCQPPLSSSAFPACSCPVPCRPRRSRHVLLPPRRRR